MPDDRPLFTINSRAPIRICDNGGWTDTWFAEHGVIFNIAVLPSAEVQIVVKELRTRDQQITIHALDYDDHYTFDNVEGWKRHHLIEAAITSMEIPDDIAVDVTIHCPVPAGASTGTSAAVTVALIGALDHLAAGEMACHEIAHAAQKIETEVLGQQCGIQDQLCSAFGGVNYIEMHAYPQATISRIEFSERLSKELDRRLVLVYLGKSHSSTRIHEMVIRSLEDAGPDCQQLEDLRRTAPLSRDALIKGDFNALGAAMIENTEAQRRLHPNLIGSDAAAVIQIARKFNALGWKVNGAGGEGGSLTILCSEYDEMKYAMIGEIEAENPNYRYIPTQISEHGLEVWKINLGRHRYGTVP
ncbi:MAG: GHMP kinase [Chloroflexota bacterium]|nr:GHMP kinase [Chloroflexota bacterium]